MAQAQAQAFKDIKSTPLAMSAVTPLDFDKPWEEIPSTHKWPSTHVDNHPLVSISVPVIDISDPKQEELDQIRYACEEWGFFHVINHGLDQTIMEEFKREMMGLFSLPKEVKLRVLRNAEETSGYGGLPVARFSPNKMWHEGFGIQKDLHEHAAKMWPPHGNPKFCQVMEDYQAAMKTLAEKVLTLMLASVGLTPSDTKWGEPKTANDPFGPHATHFQLNSYPPCPDPAHAMGLTQHTDSSIITLLNQVNGANGLQVLHKDTWVNVTPIPGSIVINSGDLAHFLFNGQFATPVHRVVPIQDAHRYSAAYFYGPPREAPLASIPKLLGPDSKAMYRVVSWKDYLNAKNMLAEKVFELLRNDKEEEKSGN